MAGIVPWAAQGARMLGAQATPYDAHHLAGIAPALNPF